MRISDEERREVAARLRGLDEYIDGVPPMCSPQVHNAMALSAIRAVVGKGDIFHLLADFIDRPTAKRDDAGENTCSVVANDEGFLVCSNCGRIAAILSTASYCPNCGAKVVE